MNHNKKRLYLLMSAILAGGIIYAAPATSTVTNLQELIDAGGVIETSNFSAISIRDTSNFYYEHPVHIEHSITNLAFPESIAIANSDLKLGQLNLTVVGDYTKPKDSITGLFLEIGTSNADRFNVARFTIGNNSHIDITGNANEYDIIGLQVEAGIELYEENSDAIVEANIGDNTTFNITNLNKDGDNVDDDNVGGAIGANAFQALATINLGKDITINTTSNGRSRSVGADLGGKVVADKGLNIHSESKGGNAFAIYAWNISDPTERLRSTVILNGASLTAKANNSGNPFAINAWAGGQVMGNEGVYHIDGYITSETYNNLSSSIDMTFDSGSTIKGASVYQKGSIINFDLKGTTWDITSNSNITNLAFSDEDSVINFVADDYAFLNIDTLSGNGGLFNLRTSIAENKGDYLYIINGSGKHKLGVKDSGVEITKPEETTLDLVSDYSGGATFNLAKIDGVNIDAVDGGTYLYYLHDRDENGEKTWYLSAEKQIDPDPTDPNPIDPTPPILETTPSTDAVISLASAPQLIMANEMNNLRFRKGSIKANAESAGVWGRVIGDSTKIKEGPAHFDLEQMGLEIGADTVLTLDSGSLLIGGMANYSWSDVKHHRGGKSKVDSYSLGLYATYFFDNGFYLDGVLKYNHFDNELRARSTQGDIVSSDYSQHGYGLSLEAGYDWDLGDNLWIEPYGKLSYISVNSKDIKLSNGMEAHIGSHDSLTSELGFSFGKDFNLENNTVFSPYVKFAWNHEFIDDNKVRINNRHDFVNDFSGDHIKAGVGFNAKIQNDLSLFGEVNYRSGSYIDDSIQANFGIRYNF